MREKIAGRGLLAGDRIIHLELREVGADGLVPVDLTFVSEDAEGESREGFGDRADGKQGCGRDRERSEEHTSELQSRQYLVCRLLLEKKKKHLDGARVFSCLAGAASQRQDSLDVDLA